MTNESEAMEVWDEAHDAYLTALGHAGRLPNRAAARIIATALEARDARIAELEGALSPFGRR